MSEKFLHSLRVQVRKYLLAVSLLMNFTQGNAQPSASSNVFQIDPKNISDTVSWNRPRNLPGKGSLNDFKKLFNGIHGKDRTAVFKKSSDMVAIAQDASTGIYYSKSSNAPGLIRGMEVIGWHPYWMKVEYRYYPYSLLSTIAFFAYDVNPENGSYNDADAITQWLTSPMIDSAKQHGANVLLTLTSYGAVRNSKFLNNEQAWLSLSDSVKMLLRARNAQGIDIDFTDILPSMKDSFVDFVSYLKNKLGDSVTVMLEIPYNAMAGAYDYQRLKPLVNTFVIQGFDRDHRTCHNNPVPPSPLQSSSIYCASIENTVENCLTGGLLPSDIVVSMPLYGIRWRARRSGWNFVENIPYEDIRGSYGVNGQQFMEELSGSSVVRLGDQEVIWYEGQGSLNRKFRWIKEKELRGAGLWGLGYDGSSPEIWTTVKSNFGASQWEVIEPVAYNDGRAYGLMSSLQKYRKIIGVSVFIIICFFLTGLLLSCLDWRVRDAFFHNNSYRALLAGTLVISLALVVYLVSGVGEGNANAETHTGQSLAVFCYGVLAGGSLVYMTNSLYLHYRKRLH